MAKKCTKQHIGMRGIKNGNKITYIKGVFFFVYVSLNIRVCVCGRKSGLGCGTRGAGCLRDAAGHHAGCPFVLLLLLTNGPCNFLASISLHISALVNLFWFFGDGSWNMRPWPCDCFSMLPFAPQPPAFSHLIHIYDECAPTFPDQINLANMRP